MTDHAYVVVDTNGRICWGLVFESKQQASDCARHPKRRVMRVEAVSVVRKCPPKRGRRKP